MRKAPGRLVCKGAASLVGIMFGCHSLAPGSSTAVERDMASWELVEKAGTQARSLRKERAGRAQAGLASPPQSTAGLPPRYGRPGRLRLQVFWLKAELGRAWDPE